MFFNVAELSATPCCVLSWLFGIPYVEHVFLILCCSRFPPDLLHALYVPVSFIKKFFPCWLHNALIHVAIR